MALILGYRWPLALVGVTSLVMLMAVPLSQALLPNGRDLAGSPLKIWSIWDAGSYLSLAQYGYQTQGVEATFIAFLPFFPLVVWAVHWFTWLDITVAGFITALVCTVASACLLYELVKKDAETATAKRAVLFLLLFPTSIFLHLPYTESLFLALVLGIFVSLRHERYLLAFALAALASATRLQGIVMVLVILVELGMHHRQTLTQKPYVWALALTIPGLGLAAYLGINYYLFGSPLHFLQVQQDNWFMASVPPWQGFINTMHRYRDWNGMQAILLVYAQLAAALIGLAGGLYALLRLRFSYAVYALGILIVSTATGFWVSVPRYIVVIFPIYIMLAQLTRRRWVFIIFLAITTGLWTVAVVEGLAGEYLY
jgi:hypothetical protein